MSNERTVTKCPDLVSFENQQWCVADARVVGPRLYLVLEAMHGRATRIVAADEVVVLK